MGSMSYLTAIPSREMNSFRGQSLHQKVMGIFPNDLPGDIHERRTGSNILFLDDGELLLVRSDIKPERLPATGRTIAEPGPPAAGATIRFRLSVNAVRRLRSGGTAPVEDIDEWVAEKLNGAIRDVTILNHLRSIVDSGRSSLQVDLIDGAGSVTDQHALSELIHGGVGRGKAYGCGLLLVAELEGI
jgi:CRISPR system Cascade subunit CasE